ncbi:hypothetical protein HUG15_15120 [Salicibibacter cibarius]|uniref:RelA/SpoT domain-containing protein n=1 Tax=Salicibibacter cibarius TaxID=2743000 RepID=A0A7T6Z4Q8_9BACI|nr:hypothetical protein HUG15_15120 [Salicibibacter cibarius]
MESYHAGLYDLYTNVVVELSSNYDIAITGRGKNEDSHDLTQHINFLEDEGKTRIRASTRQIKDYKAFHIYFMGQSNNCFPIELQVWDAKNERSNLDSHKVYKKDYTYWPTKYRDG